MMPDDAGQAEDDFCWAALVARILHPVQVQIIEALRWIGEPLSAGDLAGLFDNEPSWATLGHHLRRLFKLEAVEYAEAPSPQNVTDIAFRLAVRQRNDH
jgi:hypothetical protein